MTNAHLTDDQIQETLDAMMFHSGLILPMHLGTCARCQKRLESFQRLYAGLATDPGFALPPAFAESVLARLPASRLLNWQRPALRITVAVAACALTLAGLLIFVNMRPLASGTAQACHSFTKSLLSLGGQLKQLFTQLGSAAKPFLLGGLGLFSAALLDRMLQRQTPRRSH